MLPGAAGSTGSLSEATNHGAGRTSKGLMRNRIPADECARASEWVSLLFLDDQLSEFEELLLFRRTWTRCPDCKAYAANVTGLTKALRATPLEQPSVTFEAPRPASAPARSGCAPSPPLRPSPWSGSAASSASSSPRRQAPPGAGGCRAEGDRPEGAPDGRAHRPRAQRVSREVRPSLQAAEAVTVGPQTVRFTPHSRFRQGCPPDEPFHEQGGRPLGT